MESALKSGSVETFEFELPVMGGVRNMEARVVPCGPDEVLAILRDVTVRHRLEKEILEISAREQRRIGHNLHDGLGQFLAGLALKAKVLQQNLAQHASPFEPAATELVQLAKSATTQARMLARGLDPIETELTGLIPALQQLASDTTQLFSIACECRAEQSTFTVIPFVGVQLYRIAQEAITNAIVHAQAQHIQIEIEKDDCHLFLRIQNDGLAFRSNGRNRSGMGLRIMDYRARCINGHLEIRPEGGRTIVECKVNLTACGIREQTTEAGPPV
jgi:signal transduction histidine kinase